ncbi:mitochondrial glycerol-3-phosphate dehydrogenase [Recurvomyces mirabilis]|nr:mitochondrial glycerol-3-phosphate dehydrogenase [Recurvomyces mirabilis]
MAGRTIGSRLLRAAGFASVVGVAGAGGVYFIYRPRDIPGTEAASVPPPTYGEGGVYRAQHFPREKSRAEQIADLKASAFKQAANKVSNAIAGTEQQEENDDNVYDLLIIGGGATGTGVALDAASRGLKVALVERDDFAAGTSSKSTKLVHGGVRYLEKAVWQLDYNQYKLVREALRERRYFLDTAPHLSSWLPIMIPVQKWWQAPYFWAGTKFYDFLAGSENIESSYFLTRSKALDAFPMLKKDGLFGALVYYDGAHNDSRMNTSIAMTAALYGATIVNHAEVTALEKDADGKLCGAMISDKIAEANGGKDEFKVKAKAIINATGPFTDGIRKLDDPSVQEIVAPSSGVHVILPGYYSPSDMGLIDPNTSDGRVIFFLPWEGNTIAGTTDAPCDIAQNPIAGEEEINWILSEVKNYLQPDIKVRRGDVLAAWSGIRPLVRDPKKSKSEGLVRNHLVTTSPSGLITISGGKWTTYRQMAEEAVDEALKIFPSIKTKPVPAPPLVSGVEGFREDIVLDGTCKTHNVRLIGAHGYSKTLFINLVQHFGIDTEVAKHLCSSYGDRAWTVASLCEPTEQRYPVRGKRISELYPYVDGEVRYACRHEYAENAVDVFARRTRLAFLNAQAALEALPKILDIMTEEKKWSKARQEKEWKDAISFLGSMGLPKGKLGLTRQQVEKGEVGKYVDEEYGMYARHDRPEETLASDSKFTSGTNPMISDDSPANA